MAEESPKPEAGTSRRAQHFRSALSLMYKKAATAWTVEQFMECVGAWGERNPAAAATMRVQLGQYLQETDQFKADEILEKFQAYEGIDCLAEAVIEAKTAAENANSSIQKQSSKRRSSVKKMDDALDPKKRKDVWRSDITPRNAVHAVTVPLLEAERARLEKEYEETQRLAEESLARFREHRDMAIEARVQISQILDRVDQAKKAFEKTDMQEIESWTLNRLTGGTDLPHT
ncbi:hypothetical protein FRC20_010876 [Serendipita sp. 405]|nr:hypothetical protein FRC20_010876 [Serendipita sp. 405]